MLGSDARFWAGHGFRGGVCASGKKQVYRCDKKGIDSSNLVRLYLWRVGGQPEEQAHGLSVRDGLVSCVKAAAAQSSARCPIVGEPVRIELSPAVGEPVALAVVSEDMKERAFTKIVPFPCEVKEGNCRLTIESGNETASFFVVNLSGLARNESFKAVFVSENEEVKADGRNDA